jgi:hypothetical protein
MTIGEPSKGRSRTEHTTALLCTVRRVWSDEIHTRGRDRVISERETKAGTRTRDTFQHTFYICLLQYRARQQRQPLVGLASLFYPYLFCNKNKCPRPRRPVTGETNQGAWSAAAAAVWVPTLELGGAGRQPANHVTNQRR